MFDRNKTGIRFYQFAAWDYGYVRLKQACWRELDCHFDPDGDVGRGGLNNCSDKGRLDHFVRIALRRHDDYFPLDQLDIFVLAEHAGIDHAPDIVDVEPRRGGRPGAGFTTAMFMAAPNWGIKIAQSAND